MVLALLASLLASPVDDPPIKIWLNQDGYFFAGDRARVRVQVAQDGYLVALHADADGRLRVLFPPDPGDDARVRGGRRFEVRGRGDREAFWVDQREGTGFVLAAWSPTPFRFDGFVRGNHWDYRALALGDTGDVADPEQALLDVVHRMASDGTFDYDIARYSVGAPHAYRRGWRSPRYSPVSLRIGFGWGRPFYRYGYSGSYGSCYDSFWYDPSFCRSYYYDPFFYDRFYFRSSLHYPRRYVYTGGAFDSRLSHGPFRFKDRVVTDRNIGPRFRAPEGVLLREAARARESRDLRGGTSDHRRVSRHAPTRSGGGSRMTSGGRNATSRPRGSSMGSGRARPSGGSRGSTPSRSRGRGRSR
ncbi:MAG TPA: DUF4384 domain-containing protein [Gemmatimonadales bacterium]